MSRKSKTVRVLMFPWLAYGHISPFLELGKRLSERNFHIYLCSTPVNLSSIKPKISEKYSSSIELVELHLPSLPDLPPHYHTTKGLPPHLMNTLKVAFDMASPSFSDIIKNLCPDLIIYDFLQPWAPEIARSQNIPDVNFWTFGAGMTSFYFHAIKNVGEDFPFKAIRLHDYERWKFERLCENSAGGIKDKDRALQCVERSSGIILVKTFRELEGKYMDYLSRLVGKRVVPVGPLVQDPSREDGDDNIIEWLDRKAKCSSVFVSCGTEYFLTEREREEIAYGLELSNVNFIWVIRYPVGESMGLEEALPAGFLERVGERGLVREGWAPQARILEHPSIGGFMSHCGWSSIMESMKSGVPIIAVPMQHDQPLNARIVEEVGVGLEVKRSKSGELERGEIAKAIRGVVVEKDGEARGMSESIRNKGEREIDEVVDALVDVLRGA
ncbi:Glycosyltransferase [Psidium guajava]|nr:Glycosyltransferase [Psidium guajava]